jgi:uncharacterized protein (TIGR02147 family)
MLDIFTFFDYRSYLSCFYEEQKSRDAHFSYQLMAEKAGFKARDFIYRVIKGQKNLSADSIPKLARALDLTGNKALYFGLLVRFTQAADQDERDRLHEQLCASNPRLRQPQSAKIIPHEYYKLYAEWYHVAIRSIIEMHEFSGDWEWLAGSLTPPITPFQAKKSVALLTKLGLVSCAEGGRYVANEKAIATGEDVKKFALHSFYRWGMKRAAEAMESLPREERNITGVTLGMSAASYAKAVEKIRALRQELALLAQGDDEADRVFQCNVQVFPLSTKLTKSGDDSRGVES